MKKIIRWTATYETLIDVPEDSCEEDEAANIMDINVRGSLYQSDTWEVERITDATPEDIEEHN